ncbi:MAG: translocation/assembly module TamB [Desulfovibrio sp.]|nr:translocation/assembly module TamB [Desulfovibrio sp.]
MQEIPQTSSPAVGTDTPTRPRRRWLRRIFWGLLAFLCLMMAGLGWLCRSEGGQAWLRGQINSVLAQSLEPMGLQARLTSLSGPLPFGAAFGLEMADSQGIWLQAPDNSFLLDVTALPGTVRIDHVQSLRPVLLRLPLLPDTPPPPPSAPLTEEGLRNLLGDVTRACNALPDWLPAVRLESLRLEKALLPVALLGAASLEEQGEETEQAAVSLDASAFLDRDGLRLKAGLRLDRPDGSALALPGLEMAALAAELTAEARASSADAGAENSLEGQVSLHATVGRPRLQSEGLPADLLGDDVRLELKAATGCSTGPEGPVRTAHLSLDTLKLKAGALSSQTQARWQQGTAAWLDGPVQLRHELSLHRPAREKDAPGPLTVILNRPAELRLAVDGSVFLPRVQLELQAAGLESRGDITAALADLAQPALDGHVRVRVLDWQTLSALVPGSTMAGEASLDLEMRALQTLAEGQGRQTQQNMSLRWAIPRFSFKPGGQGAAVQAADFHGEASLTDCLGTPALEAGLHLGRGTYESLALGVDVQARGPVTGPLDVRLESSGAVVSRVDASWQPGLVRMRELVLQLDGLLPMLAPAADGKQPPRQPLGLRLTRPAELTCRQNNYGVSGLDIDISPSGHLEAQGGLAPGSLDLRLALQKLDLAPWRMLVPALPEGRVEMQARLNGATGRPSGVWRLDVRRLKLAGSPLAPLDLALSGQVEHGAEGSALTARLELPPATLKALGGEDSALRVRLPLLFGADGMPVPAMDRPLSGLVRWSGALGPLWRLVPQADRRLNGRLSLKLDLAGTLAAPSFKGLVRMDKGRFEDLGLGVLLQDIKLALDVDGKKVETAKPDALPLTGGMRLDFSLADGRGGSLKARGDGSLDGSRLHVQAKLDRLRPLRRRDVHIDLSGEAAVTGSLTAPDVKGEIRVNRGDILLNNLSVPASFTTLPISSGTAPAQATAAADVPASSEGAVPTSDHAGSLDIRVLIPGRFMVEGHGLSSQWQSFIKIGGSPVSPVISGQLRAIKGNFDFLTKKFVLSRGIIAFGGGDPANPLLDLQLTNETPDLTAQINITGTVRKMKLELTSDPSLPRDEILSRILFGRSANELGRLESLRLAAAVAELAGFGSGGNSILDTTRDILGVDVLRLGDSASGASGDPGSQSADGTTLEMGKYITEDLYMGVEQGMKSDSTAFTIQYELTPRTNLEIRSEQNSTWGGLRWKMDY